MVRVSVITVVRNDVAHLEETILSALRQTYREVEYIIIDGGSTDGTVDIIEKYADRLAYWVSEPDGGIYPAMNKGVAHATGDWINFMNSGDAFADDKVLEDIFGETEGSKDFASSHFPIFTPSHHLIGGNTINFYADGHEEIHHAAAATVIPSLLPFSHQSSFIRREDCRFDVRYRYAADYALFYHIYYKHGEQAILVVDREIARYRQEDSLSMVNAKPVKGEYLSIQAKHPTLHWLKEYIKWRWM